MSATLAARRTGSDGRYPASRGRPHSRRTRVDFHHQHASLQLFRVQDVDSGALKGYYCNLTRPAQISETDVKADDLDLDIFVKPDGEILVLDEEDYNKLPLSDVERAAVQGTVEEIYQRVAKREAPFDEILL